MKKFLALMAAAILAATMFTSCDPIDNEPEIGNRNFYLMLSNAMTNCYHTIFNQNVTGTTIGSKDITANGPMGGTVRITGMTTLSSSTGIRTRNLSYDMSGIKFTYSQKDTDGYPIIVDIIMTGIVIEKGSDNSDDDFYSMSHSSENLSLTGSVWYKGTTRTIDETGPVYISASGGRRSIDIFGYTDAW